MKLKREAIKRIALERNKEIYLRTLKHSKPLKKWWQKLKWPAWISSIATIITACFIYLQLNISNYQSQIFDNQTIILQKQSDLIDIQNRLFQEQNVKIDSQNSMFGRQNKLVEFQNEKTDAQNLLIFNQNELLDFQNDRISQQTNLQEAERRSSIVYLFSNVLDKIDEELKEKDKKGEERILSTELVARIASLTQALKPYKYLDNDTIIPRAVSPEKGQLLSALINFNLNQRTYDSIYKKSNFQNTEIEKSFLKNAVFNNINLANSVIWNSDLSNGSFNNSSLYNVILNSSNISNTTFHRTDLRKTEIRGVIGNNSKFIECDLNETNFEGSALKNTLFQSGNDSSLEFGLIKNSSDLNLNNYQNLDSIKTFLKFKLSNNFNGVFKHPEKDLFLYYRISQILNHKKSQIKIGENNLKKIKFDYSDLTEARINNYNIVESTFQNSIITNIILENIILVNTNFNGAKLDSVTHNKYFQEVYNFNSDKVSTKLKIHDTQYDLIPEKFNDLLEISFGQGWKNEGQSKKITRAYSHILKLKE